MQTVPLPPTTNPEARAGLARTLSCSVSLIHRSLPSVSVMSSRSGGLQNASQRRGVTPLVLFWNFSGKMSWKGPNTSCFRMSAQRHEQQQSTHM